MIDWPSEVKYVVDNMYKRKMQEPNPPKIPLIYTIPQYIPSSRGTQQIPQVYEPKVLQYFSTRA